jgi:branched-chain amino acid aminotransferase
MTEPTPAVVLVDGRRSAGDAAAVPPLDPGLLGQGVYESIRTYAGVPFALDRHLERLTAGAGRLDIAVHEDVADDVRRAVALLGEEGHDGECRVRVVLTAGGVRVVSADPLPDRTGERERGISAVVLPWPKDPAAATAGLKATSTAATRIGLRHARERGADTGLWTTPRGHLCEALTANVFVVIEEVLVTPPLSDGPLAGVTRTLLLDWARDDGVRAEERSVPVAALAGVREAFVSATSEPVVPLVTVDDAAVGGGDVGPVTRRLQVVFDRRARER